MDDDSDSLLSCWLWASWPCCGPNRVPPVAAYVEGHRVHLVEGGPQNVFANHHLLQAAHHVNGLSLWANLHLLFRLSLTPFVTSWMGQTSFRSWPAAEADAFKLLRQE